MNSRLIPLLLVLFPLFLIPTRIASANTETENPQAEAWQAVGDGIEYRKYHLTSPRPIDIFVTRMDRSNQDAIIDSGLAQGKNSGGTETVKNMTYRYEQVINYWGQTWGNRNDVVVAINGYFFNNSSQQGTVGVPWSGQVLSGWYSKRYDDYVGDAGFAWSLNRTAHIGDCVYHMPEKQIVSFERDSILPRIRGINIEREDQTLILYTPQFDTNTQTSSSPTDPVLEILIEMTRPVLILPTPAKAVGYIRAIHDQQGSTQIPFDHVVLSAWGDVRDSLLARINSGQIAIGDSIGISQEIRDCASSPTNNWTKTYAAVGGDYHFLNDGQIRTDFNNPDAAIPNSRTAIAYNDSYIFFLVVDRWNPGVSEGITISELANFTKNTLGATDAVAQDSGGSSTMVINGEVVNNTTCNFEDCRPPETSESDIRAVSPGEYWNAREDRYGIQTGSGAATVEPLVANSMMMIVVESKRKSDTFSAGEQVIPVIDTALRLGPGVNYAVIGTAPEGVTGTIQNPVNSLNGILATGSYWWKVSINGLIGWVKEERLAGGHVVLEADFEGTPTAGLGPLSVAFTDQSIGTYSETLWNFGDGAASTLSNPAHLYADPGKYSVTLTVRGTNGEDSYTRANYITIYEPVKAHFSAAPSMGLLPLQVQFTNTSTGDFEASSWDFGDGGGSSAEHPVHEYTSLGAYLVSLSVSGPGGADQVHGLIFIVDEIFQIFFPSIHR